MRSHSLMPGGEDMVVTNANRDEYVRLYVHWLLQVCKPLTLNPKP